MNDNHEFQHIPLDLNKASFRVVTILPGAEDDGICCRSSLLFAETWEVPRAAVVDGETWLSTNYRALSYAWGSENAVHEVTLDGQSYMVRPNLYEFLRQARRAS